MIKSKCKHCGSMKHNSKNHLDAKEDKKLIKKLVKKSALK